MSTQTLEIDGMHCEHCVEAVRDALASIPELRVEQVEIGAAEVAHDDVVSADQLAVALDEAGYDLVSA